MDPEDEINNLKSGPLAACPLLPLVENRIGPELTRSLVAKDMRYYIASLSYAQSLWQRGKAAQAILQLNKAFMADLGGEPWILKTWPPPYAVLVWILRNRPEGGFLGNPVRHFQHLATRVSGERKEIRSWRAWACFHLSRKVLPEDGFPMDLSQIEKESLEIPDWNEVLDRIESGGWEGEAELIRGVAEVL